tara:strand:- start:1751 stop:2221 length:471 start_codon:yes stop_codon:yes gene_type:complete
MIKKQELVDKIKELEGNLEVSEDEVERFIEIRDRLAKEKQKLEERITSLEQLVPEDKLEELNDGTIYRLCDPSLMFFHENRDMGIDIYCEETTSSKRRLLTRIPISVDYETHEEMSLTQKAEMLDPLVAALETAFKDHPDYHINVVTSFTKTIYTY